MKTQRDRVMAYLAVTLITLTLGGLLYFLYYDRSMSSLGKRQRAAESELAANEMAIEQFEKAKPKLDAAKRLSLPADPNAPNNYSNELNSLLTASRFPADKISMVKPKQQVEQKATGPNKQKPMFTRVLFDVQVHGDLTMLDEFLERFYRAPLLHRIKSLTVTRPMKTPDQMPEELDIAMTVEALALDGAENRKTLLPEKLTEAEKPARLARSTSQYEAIDGNNPFFGAPQTKTGGGEKKPDFNILPEIVLDGIWTDSTGTWATLFDAADDYQYVIRKRASGGYLVDKYYFIKDTKKKDFDAVGLEKLELRDASKWLHRAYTVLRVDPSDVYLENEGKIYQLHAGWRLSDVKALTNDEAAKLGLKAKDEKKDDKGKGKVDDKKVGKDGQKGDGDKDDEGR
jgi:hypothetical protein